MRNIMHRNKRGIVLGSILVALLLALFTMMSFTGSAYAQNQKVHDSPPVAVQNAPSGRADLTWNAQSKVLTATVHLSGLQPRSNHASYIHAGTCAAEGKILYPLKNVVADAAGNAVAITTINNATGGIPATGWNVAVHTGTTAQTAGLLCGNVANPNKATSVSTTLSASPVARPAGK